MKTKDILDEIISFRRYLHMYPELSNKEFNTQKVIIDYLQKNLIEYDITTNTGVIGYINKEHKGKCVALRADIDALPIKEENNVPYKSKNDGVMHACGHDAHASILLGVGILLNAMKEEINGSIKLIFQPDEEVSGGAKRIVNEGHFENVDYVLGLHVMPYIPSGDIEVKKGALNAETGTVSITVQGKAAHAAYPEQGTDSIVIMSRLISEIQTIFTRKLSPLEQSVLTFGKIYGGTKSNIVADGVTIEGTLRTLNKETREFIKNQIINICKGYECMYNAIITATFYKGYPPLINDDYVNGIIIQNAQSLSTVNNIHYKQHPSMGGEDFGYYQTKAVGSFFHLGCGFNDNRKISHLHTNTFNINDDCIEVGIDLQVQNVLSLLK